jgi:hypothetical protein
LRYPRCRESIADRVGRHPFGLSRLAGSAFISWIDDIARWLAEREADAGSDSRPAARLSRRGALTAFGGTAAAVATGTLGDPPVAEAIQRCCDPEGIGSWSCLDGDECCCYRTPAPDYGGHSECCDTARGQSCKPQPGQFDHGVQVVGCCYTMCEHECCVTPEEVCNSQGYCFACGDLERCGDECCDFDHHCVGGTCVRTCPQGQAACGDACCETYEICKDGTCTRRCGPDQTACGETCCNDGQVCVPDESVCLDCPDGQSICGDTCCPDNLDCQVRGSHGVCSCPDDSSGTFCIDRCCALEERCTSSGCVPCASGATGCGDQCCAPPFVCTIDTCDCPEGRELCGSTCCATHEECIDGACVEKCQINESRCGHVCCPPGQTCTDGVCAPCPSDTLTCGDTCCPPSFICFAPGDCRCPAGRVECEQGCCPAPEPSAQAKVAKTVEVKHGAATISVTCDGGCSGSVVLETSGGAHASMLAVISGRHRPVVLGKAKFSVPAGRRSKKVHVHLSHAGNRYMAKHHNRLKARVLVKTTGRKKAFLSRAFTLKR